MGKLLTKVKSLLSNRKAALDTKSSLANEERVLLLMFDSFLEKRKTLSTVKIANYSGIKNEDLEQILSRLEAKNIIRKNPEGNWAYNRQ